MAQVIEYIADHPKDFTPRKQFLVSHSITQVPAASSEALYDIQRLAMKVISRAARDARYRFYERKTDRHQKDVQANGQKAHDWFFMPNNKGFLFWCGILGIKPKTVRDYASRMLEKGYIR